MSHPPIPPSRPLGITSELTPVQTTHLAFRHRPTSSPFCPLDASIARGPASHLRSCVHRAASPERRQELLALASSATGPLQPAPAGARRFVGRGCCRRTPRPTPAPCLLPPSLFPPSHDLSLPLSEQEQDEAAASSTSASASSRKERPWRLARVSGRPRSCPRRIELPSPGMESQPQDPMPSHLPRRRFARDPEDLSATGLSFPDVSSV